MSKQSNALRVLTYNVSKRVVEKHSSSLIVPTFNSSPQELISDTLLLALDPNHVRPSHDGDQGHIFCCFDSTLSLRGVTRVVHLSTLIR